VIKIFNKNQKERKREESESESDSYLIDYTVFRNDDKWPHHLKTKVLQTIKKRVKNQKIRSTKNSTVGKCSLT
jgi:hypothetical protein